MENDNGNGSTGELKFSTLVRAGQERAFEDFATAAG